MNSSPRPIVLDVDTGIDDAWAIAYALRSSHLDVLGITTGFGNADVHTTTQNTLLMVQLLGKDTPVYAGADRPLVRGWEGPVPEYHGHNGLGDVDLPAVVRRPEPADAASFLRDVVRAHPHQITLVTVARLTNVARALLFDPELSHLIPRIVMMGGAAFVPGNITAVAEANIWGDPEAADLVFRSGIPITMVGLDVTMRARLTRADLGRMNPSAIPYATLLKQATEFYIRAYESNDPSIDGWCPLHDPLAVAVAEDPSLVSTRPYPVRVETRGALTDGMTVVDARSSNPQGNTDLALTLDVERFLGTFRERVGIAQK